MAASHGDERLTESGSAPQPPLATRWMLVRTCALGSVTVALSVGLISFNRTLMRPENFPFAAPLVFMHMVSCSVFAAILRLVAPSLFPSLTDPERGVVVNASFLLRGALPIGITNAMSLVCANLAYEHLSVAFLQMLKETNIILVYFFSLLASLETFAWWHLQVIGFAIFAASLAVRGEMHFTLVGFLVQFLGQVAESIRIVMMGVLLSGQKLDALSFVLLLSPVCAALLGVFLAVVAVLPEAMVASSLALPSASKICEFAPSLLANCCVAFLLNVSIALMIKHTSPVGYLFLGIVKDVCAVCVSVVALHETVTGLQYLAFSLQIAAVLTWSLLKAHSEALKAEGLLGAWSAVAARVLSSVGDGERRPLVSKPGVV